jgi:hypothetical protein
LEAAQGLRNIRKAADELSVTASAILAAFAEDIDGVREAR